jgi:hypothetical protein
MLGSQGDNKSDPHPSASSFILTTDSIKMSQVKSKLREGAPKSSGKNSLLGTPNCASSVALDQLAAFLQACKDTHRAPDQGNYQAYIRNLDNYFGSEGLDGCLLVKEYVDANPGIDIALGVAPLKSQDRETTKRGRGLKLWIGHGTPSPNLSLFGRSMRGCCPSNQ